MMNFLIILHYPFAFNYLYIDCTTRRQMFLEVNKQSLSLKKCGSVHGHRVYANRKFEESDPRFAVVCQALKREFILPVL